MLAFSEFCGLFAKRLSEVTTPDWMCSYSFEKLNSVVATYIWTPEINAKLVTSIVLTISFDEALIDPFYSHSRKLWVSANLKIENCANESIISYKPFSGIYSPEVLFTDWMASALVDKMVYAGYQLEYYCLFLANNDLIETSELDTI